jgi:hypothetical protein
MAKDSGSAPKARLHASLTRYGLSGMTTWDAISHRVMAGLDPAIHVVDAPSKEGVGARVRPAHDDCGGIAQNSPRHCEERQ